MLLSEVISDENLCASPLKPTVLKSIGHKTFRTFIGKRERSRSNHSQFSAGRVSCGANLRASALRPSKQDLSNSAEFVPISPAYEITVPSENVAQDLTLQLNRP
jgi:hypothetical protein